MAVANGYRERHLPLDVIVVDWFYYTKMGQMGFDARYWPNPTEMNAKINDMGTRDDSQADLEWVHYCGFMVFFASGFTALRARRPLAGLRGVVRPYRDAAFFAHGQAREPPPPDLPAYNRGRFSIRESARGPLKSPQRFVDCLERGAATNTRPSWGRKQPKPSQAIPK